MPFNPSEMTLPNTATQAKGNVAGAQGTNSGDAQKAIETQNLTGIPASAAMYNPVLMNDTVKAQQTNEAIDNSPGLQTYASRSGAHAASVLDDIHDVGSLANYVKDSFLQPVQNAIQMGSQRMEEKQAELKGQPWYSALGIQAAQVPKDLETAYGIVGNAWSVLTNWAAKPLGEVAGAAFPKVRTGTATEDAGPFVDQRGMLDADDPRNYVNDKERSQENYQNAFNALFGMFNFGSIFSRVGKEIGPVAEAAEGLKPAPAGGTGKVPLNTEGLHPIDENGMVVDANGNAYRFENARQAAKWQMENVTHTATGQQFNPHFDADTGTFTIREAPKAAPEGEPPAPGITPEADEVHKELTGLNLQRIQGLQEKVASSGVLQESPTALKQLLNDSGLEGETVAVRPGDILDIMETHAQQGKSTVDLHDLWNLHSAAMHAALENDTAVQVPLSDYIIATAGKPFAADMNNGVAYGSGWSLNDINELTEKPPAVEPTPIKGVEEGEALAKGPWTMEDMHKGGVFYYPETGEKLYINPSSPLRNMASTAAEGEDYTETDKGDLLQHLNMYDVHKVVPAAEVPSVAGVLPENEAPLATLAAKIDHATNMVMKERALDQLFAQPKALDLSKPMYGKWANKVEAAFQAAKDRAFKKILTRITKEYKAQWNDHLGRNLVEAADDVLTSRGMVVQHALRFTAKQDTSELAKDNEFVKNGKPVHFWHSSSVMGLGSHPEDFKNWGLADEGIDPNFKTVNYPVISFAESKEFAKNWGRGGVYYIVHLKSAPHEVGDFRRPADLKKAKDWYSKKGDFVPHGLDHGAYGGWENRKMMDANGWNAVRMVEGYKHPDPPNVGVLHGHQVYVRYMLPQYAFHPDLGLKYEELPPDVRAQFTPDEFHEAQRYFKGKYADPSTEMSVNTKIDVKEKELYKDLLEHLPNNIWGKGGISANQVATQFGYSSGEEMLKEIAEMEMDRKAAGGASFRKYVQDTIREQARQRTLDEVGNLLDPQKILDDTRAAFHEAPITSLLEEQLQALANERGLPFNVGDIKADTLEKFQQMPMRDAKNVKKWERDLQKSNKDMERGLIGDKPIPAFEAKQRVLQATYRLQAAHEARRLADRGARLIRDLKKLSAVDKMDPNFAAVIQKHVQDLHLGGRRNPIELARYLDQAKFKDATDLVGFLREMGSEMELATVPDAFRGINEEHLTWDKFTGMINLQDFESNINMLTALNKEGRRWNSIVKGGELVEMQEVANEVRANADWMGGGGKSVDAATEHRRNMWQRMAGPMRGYMAMHTRIDILLRMMDRAERGILTKTISDPMQEGKYTETRLTREYDEAMTKFEGAQEVYQNMTKPVAMPKWMQSDLDVHPTWINDRGELLGAAANLGTPLNMKKLFGGYGLPEQVWPHAERWILDQLRPEEETFLKVHWAQFQKIFPLVDKAYMDDRGYGLKKEEGRDVAFKSGTVTGGYIPLNYDRRLTIAMKAQKGTDTVIEPEIKTAGRSARKLPGNGFTHERTNYVGPLSMSSMVFRYAASEAIHDLAFRAPLRQATKLLDPDASTAGAMISQAVTEVLGPEYQKQLLPWLDYIATEHLVMHEATDDVVRHGKAIINNMAYAHIAGQIHSPLRHGVAGGIHAITEAKGDVITLSRALAMSFDPYWRQRMNEMSEEIAGLSYTQDPVLRDAMSRIPYGGSWLDKAKYLGTTFFRMFKGTEARATWLTRYMQETAKHGDSTEAILSANQAARDSQGAGHAVDQPAAARTVHTAEGLVGYGLSRFLTFLNTTFNRTQMALHELKIGRYRGSQDDAKGFRSYTGKGALGITGYILAPAFVGAAIVALLEGHKDPKDSKLVAFLKEAGWGLGENTIGTSSMGNQILSGLHPGESTGGIVGGYIENIASLIHNWGQPAATRKALQAAGEPFGLWDSIPREVQNVVDLVHPENLKPEETQPLETLQRWAAMRNARYEAQRRGRRGMGGGIRGGLR